MTNNKELLKNILLKNNTELELLKKAKEVMILKKAKEAELLKKVKEAELLKKAKEAELLKNKKELNIYCFWTGTNLLTENRIRCLDNLKNVTNYNIILVTPLNLNDYILEEHPLHEAYDYLSETHKADYLRTYFMHFHGGGYTDIKETRGSWIKSFNDLKNDNNKWICGYKESNNGVNAPLSDKWSELIGNGAYICKPKTPLTTEWYNEMIKLLDTKIEKLKIFPAKFPQDCDNNSGNCYPIGWSEMLGKIFHKVCYKYKEYLLNTLPTPIFHSYR